jgi:ligand-binding SRPBCC domain-containing protein
MVTFGASEHNFTLDARQVLNTPINILFPFFADAKNLEVLTPPFLKFEIKTPPPIEMKVGALIDYRITLRVIPLTWRTEITAWEPPLRFVDEQLRGPYSLWRHEHTFVAQDDRTLVIDHVDYRVLFGGLVNKLVVKPDLERIFTFRQQKMAELFGAG